MRDDLIRGILQSLPDLVLVIDSDLRVVLSNAPDPERQLGEACHACFKGRSYPCPECPARAVFATGRPVYREVLDPGDGRTHEIDSRPVFDAEGRVTHVVERIRDITERKATETALLETERAMSALLANLPGMAYRCINDHCYTMVFVSRGCRDLTGYAPEDLLQNSRVAYADLILPEDRDRIWATIQVAVAQREPFEFEYRIRTADGAERWVWERGVGIFGPDGGLRGLEGFVSDITEREELRAQFQQSQKMEAIGQLAGGIAHDFNNLLQIISGYAEMLTDTLDARSEASGYVAAIQRAGQRAERLIKQLLAYSRRQVLDPHTLCLNDLIGSLLEMIARVIGEHIELAFTPGAGLGQVRADSGQIEQVLVNLCVNARDAMPGGGRLSIRTSDVVLTDDRPGRYALIEVADTGIGMDRATLAQAFEPFFTTKEVGQGTGLGLSMVYGVVRQHNGILRVESEPGRGTTFRLYFPVTTDSLPEPQQPIAPLHAAGHATILVAEDDESVAALARRILETAGYRVLSASDGVQASAVFASHAGEIDLVLLDLVMPRLSGQAVHDQIRRLAPRTPILFSTGYSTETVHLGSLRQPLTALIQKPYHRDTLLTKIATLLAQRGL
jgi:two-component system, cell cycle sensor histidine kinase and response regulator CckA